MRPSLPSLNDDDHSEMVHQEPQPPPLYPEDQGSTLTNNSMGAYHQEYLHHPSFNNSNSNSMGALHQEYNHPLTNNSMGAPHQEYHHHPVANNPMGAYNPLANNSMGAHQENHHHVANNPMGAYHPMASNSMGAYEPLANNSMGEFQVYLHPVANNPMVAYQEYLPPAGNNSMGASQVQPPHPPEPAPTPNHHQAPFTVDPLASMLYGSLLSDQSFPLFPGPSARPVHGLKHVMAESQALGHDASMHPHQEDLQYFLSGRVRPLPGVQIYRCTACGDEFANRHAFGGHMSSHSKKSKAKSDGGKKKKKKKDASSSGTKKDE